MEARLTPGFSFSGWNESLFRGFDPITVLHAASTGDREPKAPACQERWKWLYSAPPLFARIVELH
jgi:hypothetical protein